MKLFVFSFLLLFSLSATAQYPDNQELQKIKSEIIKPMLAGDMDAFLERVTFPFKAGDTKYSKSQLRAAYKTVFAAGTASCLEDEGSYQMAMPDDHSWYLAVCFAAPDGYEAAVYIFKNIEGKWMLDSLDLQKD
jgi:hypothetical protein